MTVWHYVFAILSTKRAKWIRWDIKRPGVAPCSGHFQKLGRNWQRQNWAIRVVQMKKAIS